MCNFNAIVVLEFISRGLFLLFAILLSSTFQNSIFYQHMRPKSGLKFPRPFKPLASFCASIVRFVSDLVGNTEYRFSRDVAQYIFRVKQCTCAVFPLCCSSLLEVLNLDSHSGATFEKQDGKVEPCEEKTGFLHMRKQRRRSAMH